MSFETPESLATELCIFVENDGQIYHSQTLSILRNLAAKKSRGTYDRDRAVTLFMYLAETGARKYAREGGGDESQWHAMFPVPVRKLAAAQWRDEFEGEYALGNYDGLLPKKYQKGKSPVKKTSSPRAGCANCGDSSDGADLAQRVASNLSEDEITKICLEGRDPPGKKKGAAFKAAYLRRLQNILHAMQGD
jgi:hypothetical protein